MPILTAGPVQSEADVRRALKRAQEAKVPFEVRCDLQALLQLGLLTVLFLVLPWYGG